MNVRNCKLMFIIGQNGSGKTRLALDIVDGYKKRALIIDSDGSESKLYKYPLFTGNWLFEGKRRFLFEETKSLNVIMDNFRNGILFFDDYKSYVASQRDERLRILAIRRRQRNIDIIMCAHAISEINPSLFSFRPTIILFQTSTSLNPKFLSVLNEDAQKNIIESKIRIDKIASTKNKHYFEIIET